MAVTVWNTVDTKGIREDLEDIIYRLDPMDTPFLSKAGKVKVSNTLHQWQTDVLATAAANKKAEGADASVITPVPTTLLSNRTQISAKTVKVSGTMRAVDTAGRGDELAYQIAKKGKELKRDMEYALVRNQAIAASTAILTTASSLGSVESWLGSVAGNVIDGTGGSTPAYSSGALAGPTDGTATLTMTEARLKTVIAACWSDGGDPGVVMVGPLMKAKISGFAGIATQYKDNTGMKRATILGAADWYVSNFGEHQIIPNRFSRDRTVLVLDMDYWKVGTLRNMQTIDIARTGDSEIKELLVEYTLIAANPDASGKIADIGTSL